MYESSLVTSDSSDSETEWYSEKKHSQKKNYRTHAASLLLQWSFFIQPQVASDSSCRDASRRTRHRPRPANGTRHRTQRCLIARHGPRGGGRCVVVGDAARAAGKSPGEREQDDGGVLPKEETGKSAGEPLASNAAHTNVFQQLSMWPNFFAIRKPTTRTRCCHYPSHTQTHTHTRRRLASPSRTRPVVPPAHALTGLTTAPQGERKF